MVVSDIILGLVLLLAGRKFFWISAGIMGFLVGVDLAAQMFPASDWMTLGFAIILGILGAVLAMAFQWVVVLFMGFLGGGYLCVNVFHLLVGADPQISSGLFLAGGILGMVIMVFVFDSALIVISSLVGSISIVQHLNMVEPLRSILFWSGAIIGIIFQHFTSNIFEKEEEHLYERKHA